MQLMHFWDDTVESEIGVENNENFQLNSVQFVWVLINAFQG